MMSDETTNTLTRTYRCPYCGTELSAKGAQCTNPGCPNSIQRVTTTVTDTTKNQ